MKATLNILLMIFLGLSISFCSSSSKDEEETLSDSSDSSYDSSSTYDDIASASDDASEDLGSSSEYSTDDYGSSDGDSGTSSASDDFLLGGTEEEEAPAADPLPIQKIEETASAPVMDEPASDFKDGFYNIATNCNMRAEPDANSGNEGKIKAGKRLWVEGYNDGWVKVFKRSGPVFISKVCL